MNSASLSLYLVPALLVTILGVFATAASLLRRRIPKDTESLADRIEQMLPMTQCAQCGHPGCRPYAEAVADGAAIDLCPPGGGELVHQLHELMGDNAPLSQPCALAEPQRLIAVIDPAACIGCTLCLDPCPVDAIVGAQSFMHSVIVDECTGCELCVAPCPVDCISLETLPAPAPRLTVPTLGRGCINCGQCIDACPVTLQPDQLLKLCNAKDWESAGELELQRCIECGLCDRVCPSEINLAARFTHGKQVAAEQLALKAEKQRIKSRFEGHQQRLIAIQSSAEDRRAQRLAKLRIRNSNNPTPGAGP